MCAQHAGHRVAQALLAGGGQEQQAGAAVVGRHAALQPAPGFEPVHHATGGGRVECDRARQRALVDARLVGHRLQRAVLHRRDALIAQFLQKNAHRNLVQPADRVAGLQVDVDPGRVECVHGERKRRVGGG